jgi:pilus assembly protein Flp/PilA
VPTESCTEDLHGSGSSNKPEDASTEDGTMNTQILKQKLMAFVKEEEGLTTVEYAIAGSLVAVALIAAFTNLGNAVCLAINAIIGVFTDLGATQAECQATA